MILIMSAVSGIAGGAILAIVNVAASMEGADAPPDAAKTQPMLLFLVAIVIYVYAKRSSILRATVAVERLVNGLRLRICDKLRKSDLQIVEGLDKSETFSTITRDANLIAQSGFIVTNAAQQGVMLGVGMLYLAWLSKAAFLLFAAGAGVGAWAYFSQKRSLETAVRKDMEKQAELFGYLSHMLYGVKELKLNTAKSDELFADMTRVGDESQQYRVSANSFYVVSAVFADITLYLMLGSIIFILPQVIPTYSEVLIKATVAIMYVFGPLASVVGSMPQISNAESSLENLFALEKKLDEHLSESELAAGASGKLFTQFETISLQNVSFEYGNTSGLDAFSVGPVDIEVRSGEILFIVGGNGSGKTTLVKLIAGLYVPKQGVLKIDNRKVSRQRLPAYRNLFAGVFSDIHLFDQLYGVGELDQERAESLLERMEMSDKVEFTGNRFSTLELSTGQRKRLALIASLLEDRQVYLFDEWTADQDPHFREQFYHSILPELKEQGKTVIAVSHDDRYWSAADRLIKMDYGKVIDDSGS